MLGEKGIELADLLDRMFFDKNCVQQCFIDTKHVETLIMSMKMGESLTKDSEKWWWPNTFNNK